VKHSPFYTVCFGAVLGLICAALLTVAQNHTANRRAANDRAKKNRNVLDALGVPYAADASNEELVATYDRYVKEVKIAEGMIHYHFVEEGQVRSVAVHFEGQGLWGPIKGYLAMMPDLKTIRSVTFYEQEETPGLGGEIVKPAFLRQFEGMSLFQPDDSPGIRVDAISGASMTTQRVEAMLNRAIRRTVEGLTHHGD